MLFGQITFHLIQPPNSPLENGLANDLEVENVGEERRQVSGGTGLSCGCESVADTQLCLDKYLVILTFILLHKTDTFWSESRTKLFG